MKKSVLLYFPDVENESDIENRFKNFLSEVSINHSKIFPDNMIMSGNNGFEFESFDSDLKFLCQVFDYVHSQSNKILN